MSSQHPACRKSLSSTLLTMHGTSSKARIAGAVLFSAGLQPAVCSGSHSFSAPHKLQSRRSVDTDRGVASGRAHVGAAAGDSRDGRAVGVVRRRHRKARHRLRHLSKAQSWYTPEPGAGLTMMRCSMQGMQSTWRTGFKHVRSAEPVKNHTAVTMTHVEAVTDAVAIARRAVQPTFPAEGRRLTPALR